MVNSSFLPRRPNRSRRAGRVAALSAVTALALTGCNNRYGMPDPVTEEGSDVLNLWRYSLYTAVVIGAIVLALLLYSIVRHRRRDNELPKQTEGSTPLEVTYTLIPFVIVVALFVFGVKAQATETDLSKTPDLRVDVTGYQWNWRFAYPQQNVTVAGTPQVLTDESTFPEMVLPVNKSVRFNLVAADVAHSFFVPGFLTKRDLIPGVRNEIEQTPVKTGNYIGHCAELCGLNHAYMNFRVRIVTQAEFDQWISEQQQLQSSQKTPTAAVGPEKAEGAHS